MLKRTYGAGDEAAGEQVSTEALEALARRKWRETGAKDGGVEAKKRSTRTAREIQAPRFRVCVSS